MIDPRIVFLLAWGTVNTGAAYHSGLTADWDENTSPPPLKVAVTPTPPELPVSLPEFKVAAVRVEFA